MSYGIRLQQVRPLQRTAARVCNMYQAGRHDALAMADLLASLHFAGWDIATLDEYQLIAIVHMICEQDP
ncbi:MAG: hypothetical protein [Siphoviridae sp. ctdEk19]|nr:MAG: hypothetical protein [Siphoviridae sp. ctdEk19]